MALFPACAHLSPGDSAARQRAEAWEASHQALVSARFDEADTLFGSIAREHVDTYEGRESVFYRGALFIDPRNPAWDPEKAEAHLRQYLAMDTVETVPIIHRRPEAQTLLELATQLNMPAEDRVPGLQPGTRVVVQNRVVTRATEPRALRAEVERLRREAAAKDAEIRRQTEELERIRKTLTAPRR